MSDVTFHVTCVFAENPHVERKKKLVADATTWRESALDLDLPPGRELGDCSNIR